MPSNPRFMWQNFVQLGGTTLTATSSLSTRPVSWLRDQMRSKTWRSNTNWNIVEGFNDHIDFDEGAGELNATLTPGNYTAATLATEIKTQLEAAGADTYTITYSTSTNKFTLSSSDNPNFDVLWNTGTNTATSCGADIGFDVSADDTAGGPYEADNVSYHSRELLYVDLGQTLEVRAGVVINHNSGSSGTYTLKASGTDLATAITSPSFTQVLSGNSDIRVEFFTAQNYRYWVLEIDDVGNTDAYSSLGVVYIGSHFETSRGASISFGRGRNEFSNVILADQGANYQDSKQNQKIWTLTFELASDADRDTFDTMADFVGVGRDIFFSLDPDNDKNATLYCYFGQPVQMSFNRAADSRWDIFVSLHEALG